MARAKPHPTPASTNHLTNDPKLLVAFNTHTLPALPELAGEEPRALPIMEDVEPGHMLWLVQDDRHAPHLRPGDWAVIDTTDRTITWGELHLVLQSSGPILWQITQDRPRKGVTRANPHRPCIWMHPLNKPQWNADGTPKRGCAFHLSDGPMYQEYLERDLLGRVIGLFVGPRERADRERLKSAIREEQLRRQPPTIEGGAA